MSTVAVMECASGSSLLCDKAAMLRDKLKGTLYNRLDASIIIGLWNLKANCQVHKYLKCLAVAEEENLRQYQPLSYTQNVPKTAVIQLQ
jgi:hypothetical protein